MRETRRGVAGRAKSDPDQGVTGNLAPGFQTAGSTA